jgi:hypothetical protein
MGERLILCVVVVCVCVWGGLLTYINIRALTLETLLFKDSSTISILLSKTHISLDFPYKD